MTRIKVKRRFIAFILVLVLLIVLLSGMLFMNWLGKGSGPLEPGSEETVLVTVPRGTSTDGIG